MTTFTSRQTIREKLKTLILADMVGTGKPLVAVYAYQKGRLKGVSPCIVIVSGKTTPPEDINMPIIYHHIDVHSFALYEHVGTGTKESPQWTEEMSENAMDTLAQQFLELCFLYHDRTQEQNPEWLRLSVGESSVDSYTDLEGLEYRHEHWPLIFETYATG